MRIPIAEMREAARAFVERRRYLGANTRVMPSENKTPGEWMIQTASEGISVSNYAWRITEKSDGRVMFVDPYFPPMRVIEPNYQGMLRLVNEVCIAYGDIPRVASIDRDEAITIEGERLGVFMDTWRIYKRYVLYNPLSTMALRAALSITTVVKENTNDDHAGRD